MAEEKARLSELYLVGIVCYFGRITPPSSKPRYALEYIDDAHVKEVALISEIRFDHQIIFTETSEKKSRSLSRNQIRP